MLVGGDMERLERLDKAFSERVCSTSCGSQDSLLIDSVETARDGNPYRTVINPVLVRGRLINSQGTFMIFMVKYTLRDSAQPLVNWLILYPNA